MIFKNDDGIVPAGTRIKRAGMTDQLQVLDKQELLELREHALCAVLPDKAMYFFNKQAFMTNGHSRVPGKGIISAKDSRPSAASDGLQRAQQEPPARE